MLFMQGDPTKVTTDYHSKAQEVTRHMMHTPQTEDAPLLDLRDLGAGPPCRHQYTNRGFCMLAHTFSGGCTSVV